ncbi:hypothetical protein BVD23_15695 [Salmonella enterica]|nr:hypothetical protein [Salmonella enterica]ECJ5920018.1 hypothetical protein [Salmonella enterica subsp. salamae]EAN4946940.1 hypothetical protein [Salmonella enterica]EAX8455586.1 hypothetical protein [Salmonella enterica]EAX8555071.1 hypothetical protein [Salmonella enterica]
MNVACDGPSGRGPWMGRVIRSQHISNLKYEGYKKGRLRGPLDYGGDSQEVISYLQPTCRRRRTLTIPSPFPLFPLQHTAVLFCG